jgi:hypothetical protein
MLEQGRLLGKLKNKPLANTKMVQADWLNKKPSRIGLQDTWKEWQRKT